MFRHIGARLKSLSKFGFSNIFGCKSKHDDEELMPKAKIENPWRQELNRLIANSSQENSDSANQDSLDAQESIPSQTSAPLLPPAFPQNLISSPEPHTVFPQAHSGKSKEKRLSDGTVTDLKAWWGESVATWEPELAKTLDSTEPKPPGKALRRWFNY